MPWDADVYQNDRLVARIERTGAGSRLEFDPSVLNNPPPYPGRLAWEIEYSAEPLIQTGDNLPPFFLNLLPEGARLEALVANYRGAKDDFLGLLLKVGWDTVGDVTLLPHGQDPPSTRQGKGLEPGEMTFAAFLTDGGQAPTTDAAIPGVQDKLSSAMFSLPVQTRTWPAAILKLNPRGYPLLVQNEAFFVRMADDCGVPTNSSRIVYDRTGEPGLLLRRFDRTKRSKGGKLHQEDACQLLGQVPANKYHVSLQGIAEVFQQACTAPIVEIRSLIRLYAFSFLIGNADLHGKNVSLIWNGAATVMTPAYDLPSSLPYRFLDKHMAIKMFGKDENFQAEDFIRFGARYGVSERAIVEDLKKMTARSQGWIERLDEIGFQDSEAIRREILRRRDRLKP